MALVFFDTNLVIALMNSHDRLHTRAREIAEKENVIILENVGIEVKTTFLRKFNIAMLEVYKALNKARKASDELEFHKILVREFGTLIKKRPELKPFYNYIYDEMDKVGMRRENITEIPGMLNERAIELTTAFISTEKTENIERDESLHKEILSILKSRNFKDFMDFCIFCEAFSIKTRDDVVLMTDDSEFYKKGEKALERIKGLSGLKGRSVRIEKV